MKPPRSLEIYFTTEDEKKVSKGPAVEKVYPHPSYNGRWSHDICLIKMKSKVKCTKSRSPICLPDANYNVYPGQNILVGGWGKEERNPLKGERYIFLNI